MQFRIKLISIFLLFVSSAVNAEIGTDNEAMTAALQGKEPVYMRAFMDELSQRLNAVVEKKEIISPQQQRAWLIAMLHFHIEIQDEVAQNALEAVRVAKIKTMCCGDWSYAQTFQPGLRQVRDRAADVLRNNQWSQNDRERWEIQQAARQTFTSEAINIRNQVAHIAAQAIRDGRNADQVLAIAYRAMERRMLNNIVFNAAQSVASIYDVSVNQSHAGGTANAGWNYDDCRDFYRQNLLSLNPNAFALVYPWLAPFVPMGALARPHLAPMTDELWAFCRMFALGYQSVPSLFSYLPLEVIQYMWLLALPTFQFRANK